MLRHLNSAAVALLDVIVQDFAEGAAREQGLHVMDVGLAALCKDLLGACAVYPQDDGGNRVTDDACRQNRS